MENSQSSAEPVELHLAYTWDCRECGRENIIRTFWIDSGDGRETLAPYSDEIESVSCLFCGKSYDTEQDEDEWCEDDDDDDDDDD